MQAVLPAARIRACPLEGKLHGYWRLAAILDDFFDNQDNQMDLLIRVRQSLFEL
jgi:hypothetical protein